MHSRRHSRRPGRCVRARPVKPRPPTEAVEFVAALAVAGAKRWVEDGEHANKRVVAVTSGANMNFDKLRLVAERAGAGEKEDAMLTSTMVEKPGEFRKFVKILSEAGLARGGPPGGRSITEFKYRYNADLTAKSGTAKVFYSVTTASREDTEQLVSQLNAAGLQTSDMTKNELAVRHVRYMSSGGVAKPMERFFKIDFPERPGALRSFLDAINDRWDISLFHYRFSGELIGSVFVGFANVDESQVADLKTAVGEDLGWEVEDMTSDEACEML